jgi:hypothetical protein
MKKSKADRSGGEAGGDPIILILIMYTITIYVVIRFLFLITITTKTLLCSHVIT